MKKTLDLLIPTLWQVKSGFNTEFKRQSLKSQKLETKQISNIIDNKISEIVPSIQTILTPKLAEISKSAVPLNQLSSIAQFQNDHWDILHAEMLACDKCGLCNGRTHVVMERGNNQGEWMFIGDAPDDNEDFQAKPFVGEEGVLLDKMITAMGLDANKDVYITNLIKCRTPKNRNPDDHEILQCRDYLFRQIKLVKPKIIIVLGRFAVQVLLGNSTAIGKLRENVHDYQGVPVIVTFSPAYLLRKTEDKKLAWNDLRLAMKVMLSQTN